MPGAARGRPLVLDRNNSLIRATATASWCPKPRVVYGREFRCQRRDCRYCMSRKNRILGRVLVNDALLDPPGHVLTLTTHDPSTTSASFGRGVQSVTQRLRRMTRATTGRYEYFLKVEFTTGGSATSGGHRRIHAHLVAKGLDGLDVLELEAAVRQTWRAVTGAFVVEVAEMVTPAAALHYLGLHHGKLSQQPPLDWRGQTERFSAGYLRGTVPANRRQAEDELWAESLAYSTGLSEVDSRFLLDCRRAIREESQRTAEVARAELTELVSLMAQDARRLGAAPSPTCVQLVLDLVGQPA